MSALKIGGLFFGYGGLDLAVSSVLDAELAWYSEFDKGANKIAAHRFPGVPNHGDITKIDWASVEPVDIITGGSPCQDLSHAGRRAGMTDGTRSNLWVAMREAIAVLRPSLVVWENVRGAYSAEADSAVEPCPGCVGDGSTTHLRALGRVLGDLSELGYDAQWHGLRAADVGAPHGRFRVFIAAHPAGDAGWLVDGDSGAAADTRSLRRGEGRPVGPGEAAGGGASADTLRRDGAPVALLGTPAARDYKGSGQGERLLESARRGQVEAQVLALLPTPQVQDAKGHLPSNAANREAQGRQLQLGHVVDALMPTPRATDGTKGGPNQRGSSGDLMLPSAVQLLPTPTVQASKQGGGEADRGPGSPDDANLWITVRRTDQWGQYAEAIRRWGQITRPAPAPTELGPKGSPRLSAAFSEWLMGLPAGWITDVPGITRNEALKAAGNGVVPQQAAAALRLMMARAEEVAA